MVCRAAVIPPPPSGSFRPAPSALNREAAEVPSASAGLDTTTTEMPRESVIRPTGLRHGRWEAPSWAFWTAGTLVLVLSVVYALTRLGYLSRKKR